MPHQQIDAGTRGRADTGDHPAVVSLGVGLVGVRSICRVGADSVARVPATAEATPASGVSGCRAPSALVARERGAAPAAPMRTLNFDIQQWPQEVPRGSVPGEPPCGSAR
ncbi:hypothetical protein GCM10009800_00760 [Nocardiopsis rhodophaea]